MDIYTTYPVRISRYHKIFQDTVSWYRNAVDFFIRVILSEEGLFILKNQTERVNAVERLTVTSAKRPGVKYDFGKDFYKFPAYYRRAAIAEALGCVSSYRSRIKNWEAEDIRTRGRKPSLPRAGFTSPALYRKNCYIRESDYTASIKVWINNTWDWVTVSFRKSDADYILKHCRGRKECVPVLRKRGRKWYLDFSFEEKTKLHDTPAEDQLVLAVDLGINNACTCSVLAADGTVAGRGFLSLPAENDCLEKATGRIHKAQRNGAKRMPRLWARAKGINDAIAVKTAAYIVDMAVRYSVDTVVFEHLDTSGKKKGSKKQRLHHWRAQYVQSMVEDKVHRLGMRVARVCAWGTSRLAFDGSGRILRGKESKKTAGNYSLCEFQTGKVYHCDLNASYNIGARYFIREILKPLPATVKQDIGAKVPRCLKRSTCTLSDLISLAAVLAA